MGLRDRHVGGRERVQHAVLAVEDVVQALTLALEVPLPNRIHPIYNITGGEHVLLWKAIYQVLRHHGISTPLPSVPLSVFLPVTYAMDGLSRVFQKEPRITPYTALLLARTQTYDISRAKADLGYLPKISLEEGLRRTLKKP